MVQARRITLVHPHGENWVSGTKDVVRLANVMPPHGLLMLAAVAERAGFPATLLDLLRPPAPRGPGRAGRARHPARRHRLHGHHRGLHGRLPPGGPAQAGATRHPDLVRRTPPDVAVVTTAARVPRVGHDRGGRRGGDAGRAAPGGSHPLPGHRGARLPRPRGRGRSSRGRRPLSDLDSLPYPAYEKLTGYPAAYPLPIFNYPRSPATTFITSRGCPYSCSYCDRSVFGSSFRAHSAEYLVDHLAFLRSRYGIRHVNIYDDNFTLERPRVEEFVDEAALAGSRHHLQLHRPPQPSRRRAAPDHQAGGLLDDQPRGRVRRPGPHQQAPHAQ